MRLVMHRVMSVCLSVCHVCALTFENLVLETSLLVCRYILSMSIYQGHWVKVKVTAAKTSYKRNYCHICQGGYASVSVCLFVCDFSESCGSVFMKLLITNFQGWFGARMEPTLVNIAKCGFCAWFLPTINALESDVKISWDRASLASRSVHVSLSVGLSLFYITYLHTTELCLKSHTARRGEGSGQAYNKVNVSHVMLQRLSRSKRHHLDLRLLARHCILARPSDHNRLTIEFTKRRANRVDFNSYSQTSPQRVLFSAPCSCLCHLKQTNRCVFST